ncbi:MAG: LolA family protein [Planctomycetota bacterium]|jgi:outer membrane lipoprotein-sorting protein
MDRVNIEEILKKLGAEDVPAEVCKIAEETSQKFSETLMPPRQHILWENIMKTRIIKLTAAAVIIIALLAGLPFFSGNGSGVALADVLERIEQAQAFMYRTKMTMTGAMMPSMPAGEMEMEYTIIVSNEYGMKWEMTMTDANTGKETAQQMYVLPDQKVMITVMPEQKKYMQMEFDDDLLARMKKQNNDPRDMVKQIMNCEYTELGRSVIDDVEVEGFQTTDPSFAGGAMAEGFGTEGLKIRLWVDAETWLPVRAEMDMKMNEQLHVQAVIYDYQWDIPVDAAEFEPIIPEDFTPLATDGMKMPSMTEEAAVEGLKFFAEMVGQYPKKLDLMSLMQEFAAIKNSENKTAAALKFEEEMKQMTEEEKTQAATEKITKMVMEKMQPVQSLGMFYMTLVQDKKEPVYYGESVGPGDADMVLLRWKISDDQYRVIFGDLSADDVTAEELAELEKSIVEQ